VVVAAGAVAVVVLLLAIAQLVLPGIAAQNIRSRLSHSGRVLDVHVSAFPAIELLWHQADSVVVHMASYRSNAATLSSNLSQVADVGSLDAYANVLSTGLLTVRGASLHKRGNELTATATVLEADLRNSLPVLGSVQPVASAGGALTLRGTATVLGVGATVDATVRPQDGALVVSPDVPFGGLATITLFSNSKIAVTGVSATPVAGGFALTARAVVR
jgi:ubiquinone biosynthesis protein UbiJ